MLSRAKQCNVLWSHVEQQGPAAGDPSSSARPRSPPGQESSPQDTNSMSVTPYALVVKVDTFSLWRQPFFFFFDYSEPADGGCCSVGGLRPLAGARARWQRLVPAGSGPGRLAQ